MDRTDKGRFGLLLAMLGAASDKQITQARLEAYWLALSDLRLDVFEGAVQSALQSSKFFPSPAELRELAGVGTGDDAAFRAFDVVLRALPLGPYKHINFADPVINAVIRNLGGWPGFLERFSGSEAEKWIRLEFCKAYSAFLRTGVNGDACKPLAGLSQVSVVAGEIVPPQIHCVGVDGRSRIEARTETSPVASSRPALTFKPA